ncbi:WD repeat-containing protein slp1, partial [Linderina macrospora]
MSKTPTKLPGSSAFSPQTPNQVPRQLGRGRDGDYQLPQAPRSTTGRSLRGSDSTNSFRSSRPGPLQRNRGVKSAQYDRFIPNRSAMDMESAQFILSQGNNKCLDSTELAYQNMVAKGLGLDPNKRILAFKAEAPVSSKDDLRQTYNHLALKSAASVATKRRILNTPERVLDAPGLADDYYLNLLDWSMGNILAIGLDQSVYMWDASSGDVNGLCQLEGEEYIASIKWTGDGSFLAIGTSEGDVQIWDAESQTK